LTLIAKGIENIIPTNKHIIVQESNHLIHIFSKKDVQHLQTIKLPDPGKYLFLSNSMDDVYVATQHAVYYLDLQPYENQISECLEKCKGREAISIFDTYHSSTIK
jgi:hypothetical protein